MITPIAASAPIVRRRRDTTDEQRRGDTPHPGTEHEVDAQQSAGGEPSEDGVGQAVADVAHPLEHDEHADEPAQAAGDGGDDHPVAKELEVVGLQEVAHVRRSPDGGG